MKLIRHQVSGIPMGGAWKYIWDEFGGFAWRRPHALVRIKVRRVIGNVYYYVEDDARIK